MTPDKWRTCTRPEPMLKAVAGQASGRKLRLLGCAVCRLAWDLMPDPRCRAAVEAAEAFADGEATEAELVARGQAVEAFVADLTEGADPNPDLLTDPAYVTANAARRVALGTPAAGVRGAIRWAELGPRAAAPPGARRRAATAFRAAVCDRIREVIGPPDHPLVLMPGWALRDGGLGGAFRARVSATARGLAEGIAHDRAFDRLPILADALEDVGLNDLPLLDHLRHGTGHVRGCWALDLVLGRA